jgi:hypothetical protein
MSIAERDVTHALPHHRTLMYPVLFVPDFEAADRDYDASGVGLGQFAVVTLNRSNSLPACLGKAR